MLAMAGSVLADPALILDNADQNIHVELTMEDLLALPQIRLQTDNDFVDNGAVFIGPLARDIVAMLGDEVKSATFTAVNDYFIEIPVADFQKYDVIFALSINGAPISLRDRGPIWLIYPMSDHPELQDRIYNDRLIWQLVKVTAK